ncbi:hypothetical protein Q2465_24385, partial [Escherichia coli]|nr:hypothetical protein [Escherichia coli]
LQFFACFGRPSSYSVFFFFFKRKRRHTSSSLVWGAGRCVKEKDFTGEVLNPTSSAVLLKLKKRAALENPNSFFWKKIDLINPFPPLSNMNFSSHDCRGIG